MAGAWLANYSLYPAAILAPITGLLGALGVVAAAGAKPGGDGLCQQFIEFGGRYYDGGRFVVPVCNAIQLKPESQFDHLGFGFQPFDAGNYVLGSDDSYPSSCFTPSGATNSCGGKSPCSLSVITTIRFEEVRYVVFRMAVRGAAGVFVRHYQCNVVRVSWGHGKR